MKEMIYDPSIKNVVLLDNGTYEGFEYYIVNRGGEYPLAYIKVPDNIKIDCEDYFNVDINSPHGGITFGCENDIPPLLEGVASKGNYLGWDYAHYDDYLGWYYDHWDFDDFDDCDDYVTESFRSKTMKRWTTKEILEQVKNTIEEIRNAER